MIGSPVFFAAIAHARAVISPALVNFPFRQVVSTSPAPRWCAHLIMFALIPVPSIPTKASRTKISAKSCGAMAP